MARKAAVKKVPHLRDLFKTGELITLPINSDDPDNPVQVEIFLRKPLSWQYEEAVASARAKQARRRKKLQDPKTDESSAYKDQTDEMGRDELIDALLEYEKGKIHQTAYNTALYKEGDDGEYRWGKDGSEYVDLLTAVRQRYNEIREHNNALPAEDPSRISLESDPEILRLNESLDEFESHVKANETELTAAEKADLEKLSVEKLRQRLLQKMIDTDVSLVFYQEYKMQMLLWACRYPDNHEQPYFQNVEEIWSLPDAIRGRLVTEFDQLESGLDDLKNSLSPLLS